MAASTFSQAVDCLVRERDEQFLKRVSVDYNLDLEELRAKYIETAATAIKIPKVYKPRAPKAVTVVTEGSEPVTKAPKVPKAPKEPKVKQICTACTSKKEPCKFSAIKGEVFCKRHLKRSLDESSDAPKEPKAKKAKKGPEPVHTHPLTTVTDEACELCQSHGNPLAGAAMEFELVPAPTGPACGPVKNLTTAQRLAALLADSDDESDEPVAPEAEGLEAFEDEDEADAESEDESDAEPDAESEPADAEEAYEDE
jgi:hypothetical protein